MQPRPVQQKAVQAYRGGEGCCPQMVVGKELVRVCHQAVAGLLAVMEAAEEGLEPMDVAAGDEGNQELLEFQHLDCPVQSASWGLVSCCQP